MEAQNDLMPKKRRGRPRSFPQNSTVKLTVTVETRQKEWLDNLAAASPSESASNIVRQALDLWYAVNVEKTIIAGAPQPTDAPRFSNDDLDLGWDAF